MKRFMFDTCVFNHILEQNLDLDKIKSKGQFFVTHIQRDELKNCKDEKKRGRLLALFLELQDGCSPTESSVLAVSRLGGAKLSDGSIYETIKHDLDKIEKNPNNIQDALIGETALKNQYILVTDDTSLRDVMKRDGCTVIALDEFLTP